MSTWKFTDTYTTTTYPALANSILDLLQFSSHTITGTAFTGTIDVASTGVALSVLSLIVDIPSIDVTGTVTVGTDANKTLTVNFTSTDGTTFLSGVTANFPLLTTSVVTAAGMTVNTVTDTSQKSTDSPTTDQFTLDTTLTIGTHSVAISASIPMSSGMMMISGTFTNVGISLSDLGFLMGTLSSGDGWFPNNLPSSYTSGASFNLISLNLTAYVTTSPSLSITISSVSVEVGITQIDLYDKRLYLNPIGVICTVGDPTGSPTVAWGLTGTVDLLNYNNTGIGGLSTPDFSFTFNMAFPSATNPDFAFSSYLSNPDSKSVNTMISDLMGSETDIVDDSLTIDSFTLDTDVNATSGSISDFSTSIVMSGGFGLLSSFSLENISINVSYTGDS